jgi:hypothetical protein
MPPRFIKPIEPPRILQPSDNRKVDPKMQLDSSELFLFDIVAQEPINISGTECLLYTRNNAKSKVDPLYSEPAAVVFDGPYKIIVNIEWPESTPEAGEEGLVTRWPSGAWIPRKSVEEVKARAPREGDVLHFWQLPYFDQMASQFDNTPNAGYFFDIIKVNDDGHVFDSPAFVAFRCNLKRRSSFGPEQNIGVPANDPNDPCQ